MIRRPPRSTRTDTLFPYTTLFRSDIVRSVAMPPPTLSRTIGRQGNIRQTVPHGSAAMLRGSHDIETRRAAHQHFRTYFRTRAGTWRGEPGAGLSILRMARGFGSARDEGRAGCVTSISKRKGV